MKKIYYFALIATFASCQDEFTRTDSIGKSTEKIDYESKQEIDKVVPTGGFAIFHAKAGKLDCGTSFGDPINVDPNLHYISNYNVGGYDTLVNPCPNNGKPCITLSELMVNSIAFLSYVSPVPQTFFGYSSMSQFENVNSQYREDFSIGQDGFNESTYGSLFDGPDGYMSNDAVNTIYHYLQNSVNVSSVQGKKIKAVYAYRDALLCIPSYRFIKLSIKYDNQ